jgi:KDO2-lipid IV(A) lauroyltransferase
MKFRHRIEAACLHLLFCIFRLMPLDAASATGGWVGRIIGPLLPSSQKAHANLRLALPGKGNDEYKRIVTGMWDNLGRVMAEYPHLEKIGRERTEIVNPASLAAIKEDELPAILFSGHMANWEVIMSGMLYQADLPLDAIYRAPNNPGAAKLLDRARTLDHKLGSIPKSRGGTRAFVQAMQQNRHIAMLIDQKYNEGIAVPFFGHPAMTATAFILLCQKFHCPLIPLRVERLEGARFRLTAQEPMVLFDQEGGPLPPEIAIARAHEYLEGWIRERPEQWLWIHRRWNSAAFQSS